LRRVVVRAPALTLNYCFVRVYAVLGCSHWIYFYNKYFGLMYAKLLVYNLLLIYQINIFIVKD
jgi:hypothetical protein